MFIFFIGMISLIVLWCQIGYYTSKMYKYRKLANMERERLIALLGYAPEEPPML